MYAESHEDRVQRSRYNVDELYNVTVIWRLRYAFSKMLSTIKIEYMRVGRHIA